MLIPDREFTGMLRQTCRRQEGAGVGLDLDTCGEGLPLVTYLSRKRGTRTLAVISSIRLNQSAFLHPSPLFYPPNTCYGILYFLPNKASF